LLVILDHFEYRIKFLTKIDVLQDILRDSIILFFIINSITERFIMEN
jgi:hypothetical protein